MTTAEPLAIPAGYMQDAQGRLVPVGLVRQVDLDRNRLVLELVAAAQAMSQALAAFKGRAMADVQGFVERSAAAYGVKCGGAKGNVTLLSFDGRYKICRQIADQMLFDERLQAAKALIDECIQEWTQGSRQELRALVDHAFQVDQQGKVQPARILGLRRLEIQHPRWQQAMAAIGDSINVIDTKPYVRLYERAAAGDTWKPISLDLASV